VWPTSVPTEKKHETGCSFSNSHWCQ